MALGHVWMWEGGFGGVVACVCVAKCQDGDSAKPLTRWRDDSVAQWHDSALSLPVRRGQASHVCTSTHTQGAEKRVACRIFPGYIWKVERQLRVTAGRGLSIPCNKGPDAESESGSDSRRMTGVCAHLPAVGSSIQHRSIGDPVHIHIHTATWICCTTNPIRRSISDADTPTHRSHSNSVVQNASTPRRDETG